MLDYQYQHNAHVVDWRMFTWMKANPAKWQGEIAPEQREYEREWQNEHSQRHFGWIKR